RADRARHDDLRRSGRRRARARRAFEGARRARGVGRRQRSVHRPGGDRPQRDRREARARRRRRRARHVGSSLGGRVPQHARGRLMIAVELRKQIRRLRTYIGLGICFGLPVIITIALKVGGPPRGRGGNGAEEGFFRLATKSGVNMPIAALSVMSMFLLPIVIMLFFGESVAGEAGWGSLRYFLVRPVNG